MAVPAPVIAIAALIVKSTGVDFALAQSLATKMVNTPPESILKVTDMISTEFALEGAAVLEASTIAPEILIILAA